MAPVILDLFCCQGGASRGYADAGFQVVCVDIERQPRYPFRFIQDRDGLREAIPSAYTEYIGRQLIEHLAVAS